jgi:lysophospholipase L1-like esterase
MMSVFAFAEPALIRVACVGDSITFGLGVRDRKIDNYPAQLGRWLGAEYDVRNFGVSGATLLSQGDRPYIQQKAYKEALAFKPDIVVISLGTNDSKQPLQSGEKVPNNWQYKQSYVSDYIAMVAAFRKVSPSAKIYVCLPTPCFPGRWGINDQTIHEEIIPMVRTVAKETESSIIDLYAALTGKAALFADTVHPNDEGAGLIAAAVYRALAGREHPVVNNPRLNLFTNRRVLWLGDSITQNGRYVSYIEYYLEKKFPSRNFDFISIGLSSETVSGLSEKSHPFPRPCVIERLQRALVATGPATVVACYGMNDGIYHPKSEERARAFQDGIRFLSDAVQTAEAEFVLLTPSPFEAEVVQKKTKPATAESFGYGTPFVDYDYVLVDYSQWERSLSVSEARVVVDLHTTLDAALMARRQKDAAFGFTKDGIHPSPLGHLLMAHTFLRALGVRLDPEAEKLDDELARVEADPLFKLINERREKRSEGWLSFVGYTREKKVKTDSVTATEIDAEARQKQIDELRRR